MAVWFMNKLHISQQGNTQSTLTIRNAASTKMSL